jgi:hypothetical protein
LEELPSWLMAGWLLLHVVRGTSTSEKKHNLPQTLSELVISSSRERKRERERERERKGRNG